MTTLVALPPYTQEEFSLSSSDESSSHYEHTSAWRSISFRKGYEKLNSYDNSLDTKLIGRLQKICKKSPKYPSYSKLKKRCKHFFRHLSKFKNSEADIFQIFQNKILLPEFITRIKRLRLSLTKFCRSHPKTPLANRLETLFNEILGSSRQPKRQLCSNVVQKTIKVANVLESFSDEAQALLTQILPWENEKEQRFIASWDIPAKIQWAEQKYMIRPLRNVMPHEFIRTTNPDGITCCTIYLNGKIICNDSEQVEPFVFVRELLKKIYEAGFKKNWMKEHIFFKKVKRNKQKKRMQTIVEEQARILLLLGSERQESVLLRKRIVDLLKHSFAADPTELDSTENSEDEDKNSWEKLKAIFLGERFGCTKIDWKYVKKIFTEKAEFDDDDDILCTFARSVIPAFSILQLITNSTIAHAKACLNTNFPQFFTDNWKNTVREIKKTNLDYEDPDYKGVIFRIEIICDDYSVTSLRNMSIYPRIGDSMNVNPKRKFLTFTQRWNVPRPNKKNQHHGNFNFQNMAWRKEALKKKNFPLVWQILQDLRKNNTPKEEGSTNLRMKVLSNPSIR